LRLIPIHNRFCETKDSKKVKLYKDKYDILHDNCLLTDYGYFNWGSRDEGFKLALKNRESIDTRFSTIFKSNEFDLSEIFSFFNEEIFNSSKKIKKVGNLFEIN